MTKPTAALRDWLFRSLMFEAEAEHFRKAGIRVGADMQEIERSLMEESLSPFPIDLRNEAVRMARLSALLYCFENAVRQLIKDRLQDKYQADWWIKGVPGKVQKFADDRQKAAEADSWLEGETTEKLGFVDFGHLADIITKEWEEFQDLIPSQHWLKQRMDDLEKARNFIAHHRLLLPNEFARIEMYVTDWNRMVGL